MKFPKRNYLGVDISTSDLQAVCLVRAGKGARLSAARSRTLADGLVVPRQREPNLTQPNDMIAVLRELLAPLAGREERVALSLPDSAGRLFLHEMETVFKSREEGLDILRWKLKGSLPAPPAEVQLDYQILNKNENGRFRLLVSVMATKVLDQYEKLFNSAGYQPVVIDFHSLNVLGYFQSQIDFTEDLVLIVVDGPTLVFQYFQNGQLVLQRCRETGRSVERIFQEVNRSISGSKEKLSSLGRARAYLQSDWSNLESLQEAVSSVLERPIQILDPKLEKLVAGPLTQAPPHQGRSLVAALGAAGRLM